MELMDFYDTKVLCSFDINKFTYINIGLRLNITVILSARPYYHKKFNFMPD